MAPARISVLGPLAVQRGSVPVPLGSGRHRAVLARLALTPHRPVSRDELTRLLWTGDAPPTSVNAVQAHVSRLRRILAPYPHHGTPDMVVLTAGGYSLRADEDDLDLLAFRSRLARWRRLAPVDPQQAFEALSDAVDLWRGHDAAEDVPELQGDPLVAALSDELIEATVRLAHLGETLRRLPEVLSRLRPLAARHPWHESLHARLVVALATSGQQAAALEAYEHVRRHLADELGVDPGRELTEARQSVLDRRWDGRRRPEPGAPRTPWQAPAPPPDFTGRAAEARALEQLLRSTRRRAHGHQETVGVISGLPGAGKTSLALRVAQTVRATFPDGQLYLELHGSDDAPLTAADALGRLLRSLTPAGHAIPTDPVEAESLYRTMLADRRMLILLDNARNGEQVRRLLPPAGGSAAVVTSRNRCVGLDDAIRFDLPVLTPEETLDLLGRRIGTARVTSDRDTATAIGEACGRLPVALRMVAGRLAARPEWTTRDLLKRLTDTRSRLDQFSVGDVTVRAGFELSYRDLEPGAAEVFRMAALIPGDSFCAAAVTAALPAEPAGARADAPPAEQVLEALVAESLLHTAAPGRYGYHDLLRLYALERLEAQEGPAGQSAALGRLGGWFLSRTAAAMRLVYPKMVRLPGNFDTDPVPFGGVDDASAWLAEESDTLVALIEVATRGEHRALAWQLADQLRGYFFVCRDVVAWLATGRAGLAAADAAGDEQARAAMYQTSGQAEWSVGRHEAARDAYQRGVGCAERSGWRVGEAYLLHNVGLVQAELGRVEEAQALYRRALDIGAGPEFTHVRAVTLNDLGALCMELGRLDEAAEHLRAALELNQGAARRPSNMINRANLGMVLRQLRAYDEARDHLTAALEYFRDTGSASSELWVLDAISQLNCSLGEWSAAVDDAAAAVRIAERLHDRRSTAAVLNTLGFALLGARAVTDARNRFETALRLSRDGGFQYLEAQAGLGMAEVLLAIGDEPAGLAAAERAREIARHRGYTLLVGDAEVMLARLAGAAEVGVAEAGGSQPGA